MEKKYSVVLVEDEPKSRQGMKTLLARYCPDVEVVGEAGSVKEARACITENDPDLIFLDISLPDGEGFDVTDHFPDRRFGIIFTTAHEEYALRAFRVSAVDYLLKPVSYPDLQQAMARFRERRPQTVPDKRIDVLRSAMEQQVTRLAVPTLQGFEVVLIDDIVRCEADSNYTRFHLAQGQPLLASRSLAHYESLLESLPFVRVHHKHLVHLRYVKKYHRGRGGYIEFADGSQVEVAARKKDEFMEQMARFARGLA